ncbi:unnamed protein product (macronuclear) [Paramecium tetraurelia]|uniref:Uncharacterized protein n=1 Tax=Paramecium tetraurelia TaxID=5888 RepID=A0BU71_PARTE|nr:uncharacterized protein GSPATT00032320001 [Paramecium tetraurelia]CAK62088.1 unnamed protein product [Paramecium tetraurelia]|eukprot:XP_001429486.1 hypothetical protein (macronuclear) [Paramecium tetraurelia strain d4-2]
MSSITQLDQEYRMLFEQIMGMLDQLSSISLEFVSSKLTFLEKYSQTLKSSQVDARQHRNNQIKNLIEYVKMHRKSKVRSVIHSPSNRTFHHHHHNSLDMQDVQLKDNISVIPNSSTAPQKSLSDTKLVHTKTIKNMLQKMVSKKNSSPQKSATEPLIKILESAMALLETHQQFYQDDYDQLKKEYDEVLLNNPQIMAKVSLQNKSSKIKENLNSLIETQKSFKSYLNSIM